jgi:quinol monooxygenase YgiN
MQGNSGRLRRNRRKFPVTPCAPTTSNITIVSVLCILLTLIFYGEVSALGVRPLLNQKMSQPPFSLLVTLLFTATEHKEQFLRDFAPVAAHVQAHEPDTLAYEVLLSDQDSLQVLVLERYKDKDHAYLIVHRSSEPFLAFRPKLKAMQDAGDVTVSGHSYLDAKVGFGDRCT